MVQAVQAPYPVQFDVDYPEQQSRWKALFRLVLALPAFIFAALVSYASFLALFVMWLGILVRGRIPRWLFDFQVGVLRFNVRTQAYVSLLTDTYPAWDGDYPVTYEVAYPERVSRWKVVIWKFATALPQLFVVTILQYASFAIVAIGWLVIILTGKFPKGLHTFVVGTMRWRERVYAYALSLTDEYPPYSMDADAPAATGTARAVSNGVGVLGVAGLITGIVLLIVLVPWGGEERVVHVSYSRLVAGDIGPRETFIKVGSVEVDLVFAIDPADEVAELIEPRPGYRLVLFSFFLTNLEGSAREGVFKNDFQLSYTDEADQEPLLAVAGRREALPVSIGFRDSALIDVLFEVPNGTRPDEVSYGGGFLSDTAVYEFR